MAVRLKEATAPAFQSGDMAYEFYHLYDKAVLVAAAEHIEGRETEEEYDSEYDANTLIHQYTAVAEQPQRDIEEDARKPEPEMREHVHHGIEYDAARGAVLVHVAAELHDAPRLSSQSAYGGGIVQGVACDGEADDSLLSDTCSSSDFVPRMTLFHDRALIKYTSTHTPSIGNIQ